MKQSIVQCANNKFEEILLEATPITTTEEIDSFITEAYSVPEFSHYKVFSTTSLEKVKKIETAFGKNAVKIFLRLALLRAVVKTIEIAVIDSLPERLKSNQYKQLHRISESSDTSCEWLSPGSDIFQKEFGLATMRLYAAGCQVVDVRCGLPRSIIFKQGLFGVPELLWKILRLGGVKPLFQIHVHKLNLDNFNEAGREECYLCCVELYQLYPQALGMFGASWFYDPALDDVSPKLSYLRSVPEKNGAFVVFINEGDDARENALQKSASRRKLYEDGMYTPRHYMLIWPKKCQIKWALRKAQSN